MTYALLWGTTIVVRYGFVNRRCSCPIYRAFGSVVSPVGAVSNRTDTPAHGRSNLRIATFYIMLVLRITYYALRIMSLNPVTPMKNGFV